jgi:hypothetical protein
MAVENWVAKQSDGRAAQVVAGRDFSFRRDAVPGAMINIFSGPSTGLFHPACDGKEGVMISDRSYRTTHACHGRSRA